MDKQTILSLFRTILTLAGSYIIGHHFLGKVVGSEDWSTAIGIILALSGSVWGIIDKTSTIEALQSSLRSAIIFVGGFFVAKGTLSADMLNQISGLVLTVLAFLYSALSRKKSQALFSNKMSINNLKK